MVTVPPASMTISASATPANSAMGMPVGQEMRPLVGGPQHWARRSPRRLVPPGDQDINVREYRRPLFHGLDLGQAVTAED